MSINTLPAMPGASVGQLPIHPRTGLTAVGIVSGKPVWPIMGGSAPVGEPTTPPQPSGPAPQPQQDPAPKKDDKPQDVASLPDWAQKIIKDTRDEAAKHRTDKQTATQAAADAKSQRDAILKAAGLKPDGTEDIDPAKLTEQVAQFQAVAWENALQLQVVRNAASGGYDADALLDSNAFLNSLVDLVDEDPGSDTFRNQLKKHVKDFVADNPKFKATTAGTPARSGGDMPPGQPGTPRDRPKSLMDAVSRHFKAG